MFHGPSFHVLNLTKMSFNKKFISFTLVSGHEKFAKGIRFKKRLSCPRRKCLANTLT